MVAAGFRAEVSGHFRGVHGLEEELAFEQLGEQQDRQRGPWLDEGDDDGEQGERDAAAEDDAERAELEAGAVDIGRPWGVLVLAELEEAEFRDELEEDGGGEDKTRGRNAWMTAMRFPSAAKLATVPKKRMAPSGKRQSERRVS